MLKIDNKSVDGVEAKVQALGSDGMTEKAVESISAHDIRRNDGFRESMLVFCGLDLEQSVTLPLLEPDSSHADQHQNPELFSFCTDNVFDEHGWTEITFPAASIAVAGLYRLQDLQVCIHN